MIGLKKDVKKKKRRKKNQEKEKGGIVEILHPQQGHLDAPNHFRQTYNKRIGS